MTTHEKAQLIKFANYCEQIADSDRRASRKWETQYCDGYARFEDEHGFTTGHCYHYWDLERMI